MGSKSLNRRVLDRALLHACVILFSGLPVATHAAWTDITPSGANPVVGYGLDPNDPDTIYTTNFNGAGSGGIWKSLDSGDNWVGAAALQNAHDYHGIAVRPGNGNIVIAGVRGAGGIERSVNAGSNWSSEGTGSVAVSWVISFSQASPDIVFAGGSDLGTGDSGLFLKSVDSGDSWSILTVDGDNAPNVIALATDPNNAQIVYAGVKPVGGLNDGLYKSTNGGASWTLSGLTLTTVDTVVVDPNDSNIIYAGSSQSNQIWRSTDGGTSWSEIQASGTGFSNFRMRGLAIDPEDSRVIYAAGGSTEKVIASVDCGATWTDVSAPAIVSSPGNLQIDTTNNFVYLNENLTQGKLYREILRNGLASPSGACPGSSPSNNPPVAVNDPITATEDTPFNSVTDLDANDTDADGDPLTVVPGTFGTAQGGSITISSDGSYTYTPATNFNGNDSVNYTVTDGSASDSGTLIITVDPVDDPPVAVDDAINAIIDTVFVSSADLDANDLEVDGEALTVTAGTFATTQGGSITIASNGSYTYTPPAGFLGADSVVYTVTDGITPDNGTLNIAVTETPVSPSGGGGGSSRAGSPGWVFLGFMVLLGGFRLFRSQYNE